MSIFDTLLESEASDSIHAQNWVESLIDQAFQEIRNAIQSEVLFDRWSNLQHYLQGRTLRESFPQFASNASDIEWVDAIDDMDC